MGLNGMGFGIWDGIWDVGFGMGVSNPIKWAASIPTLTPNTKICLEVNSESSPSS
jgi:hypothetical protein